MSERDETREAVARAICAEVNPVAYDALPEAATYLERKTHIDRPILDKAEALSVADAVLFQLRIGSRFTVEGVECVVAPVAPDPEMVVAGEVSLANDVLRAASII